MRAVEAPQGTSPTTASFPTERVQTPTYADLYCAGFISKQTLPDANLRGGRPADADHDQVHPRRHHLSTGTGYTAGAEYEVVRALRDVNEYEMFPGQKKLLKETGQPYEEVGRVKIVDTRSQAAIAQIEYACDGDQSRRHHDSICREAAGHLPYVRSVLIASCPASSKAFGPHRDGERLRLTAGNRA